MKTEVSRLRVMRSGLIPALLLGLMLGSEMTSAQLTEGDPEDFAGLTDPVRVVHILNEPRHRTVYHQDDIRLLDIQINPGDTTLPHTHDNPILYTFISNGEGPLGGRLSSATRYVDEPYTHRVTNEGPGLFRIVALASFTEPAAEGIDDWPSGLSSEADLENEWFRAWRLTLQPGERSDAINHLNPAFVIQVSTEGGVHVERSDGITSELLAPGDWSAPREPYVLYNPTFQPVSLVVNEARTFSGQ